MDSRIYQKAKRYFANTEEHQVIMEFLSNGLSMWEIWQKHSGAWLIIQFTNSCNFIRSEIR